MKDNRLVIHNITSVYLSIYRRLKAKTHFYVVNYFLYILYLAYKTKWIHVKWCVQFCESFFVIPALVLVTIIYIFHHDIGYIA